MSIKKTTVKTKEVKTTAKATVPEKPAVKAVRTVKKKETAADIQITVNKKKSVLFACSEALPFIASGGLAEVAGSLPKAIAKYGGYDVRVILPLYSDISAEYKSKLKFVGYTYVPLAWRNQYCGIFELEHEGVTFYFVDNEYYFKRPGAYGHFDDGERFAFFSRSIPEVMRCLNFYPDMLHCNDWQTALAVVYMKTIYCIWEEYRNIKIVFTIHNIQYQGKYSIDLLEDLFGISRLAQNVLEFDRCLNLMKGAIECCDVLTTVSPKYAEEIKTVEFAEGLQNIINKNSYKLSGILNGIDTDLYNSEKDGIIFKNFSAKDLSGKAECKEELQKMLSLPIRENVPVIAVISRLVPSKGIDLIKTVIDDLLKEDIQFILLGKGDMVYESYFTDLNRNYAGKVCSVIAFNHDLSRKIYSGADMFLMPSRSEPCGLAQMIASRYGTIPIVRETGGLFDSIKPCGVGGNGFTFKDYNAYDMLYVIRQAVELYNNKAEWKKLMKKAMAIDFSWGVSAGEYQKIYNNLLSNK